MMKTGTKQLIGTVTEFVKQSYWEKVTVKVDRLDSREAREAVTGMLIAASNI